MKNTVENNNPEVSIDEDGFGVIVYDKSKPIGAVDLTILKSRRFGKPLTLLHTIPYMITEDYRKGNISKEQFLYYMKCYEERWEHFLQRENQVRDGRLSVEEYFNEINDENN